MAYTIQRVEDIDSEMYYYNVVDSEGTICYSGDATGADRWVNCRTESF